jgi:hypothetical protein
MYVHLPCTKYAQPVFCTGAVQLVYLPALVAPLNVNGSHVALVHDMVIINEVLPALIDPAARIGAQGAFPRHGCENEKAHTGLVCQHAAGTSKGTCMREGLVELAS